MQNILSIEQRRYSASPVMSGRADFALNRTAKLIAAPPSRCLRGSSVPLWRTQRSIHGRTVAF
ncbi:MAG: hypothetical protein LBK00_03600 [Treponema sp.]|nr:hypothetical protein [Treponema sp.]